MIRSAVESDFLQDITDECAVRIHSLLRAYGIHAPFVRYYADEYGNLLSIMDGNAVLSCHNSADEWLLFLTMNPDILHIHCSADIGRKLIESGAWKGREGQVLVYEGNRQFEYLAVCDDPYLPDVHVLLCTCFDEMAPLNAWYPDVSHRLRHDCGKIAVIKDDNRIVSTAMTVAETDAHALIGQVATHPDFRGRGYAKTCINSIISRCKAKKLYILPVTETAHYVYTSMGFVPDGAWAELQRN